MIQPLPLLVMMSWEAMQVSELNAFPQSSYNYIAVNYMFHWSSLLYTFLDTSVNLNASLMIML